MSSDSVSILGAGAFGTALAIAFARAGREVTLWGRNEAYMTNMASTRLCGEALPGIALEAGVTPTPDAALAVQSSIIVFAVPTQNLRQVCADFAPLLKASAAVILSAAKGIEQQSGDFVTEIMAQCLGEQSFGVISGPSFAVDIARGLPTAISLAVADADVAERIARFLSSPSLRLYHTGDVRGVEIGGAAKNVLAIAAGIVIGMGLGESARAAMVTRGFAELRRFAEALGARAETLVGLSGLGDLVLTASTAQSRNFVLGLARGSGKSPPTGKLAEGAFTAPILARMAHERSVEMPIVEAVARILDGTLNVKDALSGLMARPLKAE